MSRRRCDELGGKKLRVKLGRRRRMDVVIDLCCGTATSASKFYLLKNTNAIVIGIDRYKSESWVKGHLKDLPREARDRFFFFREDVSTLTMSRLRQLIRRACRSAWVSRYAITRVHWSPPCETLSRATRGKAGYRDRFSRPLRAKAKRHDHAFEAGVALVRAVQRACPRALFSIENPVGDHFLHLPGSRELLKDSRWHVLCSSHCKCACEIDGGPWPQKDTYWLVSGVSRNFALPLCERDCSFLLPGTRRHKAVICNSKGKLPQQVRISDPMDKGRIPLGAFKLLEEAHQVWLRRHQAFAVEEADSGASTESEEANDEEEEMAQPDERAPLDEDSVSRDGRIVGENCRPLRASVPRLKVSESQVPHWAIAYPGLFGGGRWDIAAMQPGSLWFFDIVSFDFRVKHNRVHLLIGWSIVEGSVRVRLMRSKSEAGSEFDKLVTMESLDKRGYKVTIAGDGCGAVGGTGDGGGLIREAAYARGLDFYPLEPNRPQLNPVEGLVASFKADVASVLLPAIRGGGIDESFVSLAAQYCAATIERFAQIRDYRRGDHRSAFELNTGVKPDVSHLVPFGMPGFAFVPKEVRARRGAPKYMRSEPVLMLGYQHVYSKVYKCLTRHNTIVHTSQVQWLPGEELGVFPGMEKDAPALISEPSLETDLFDKSKVKSDKRSKTADPASKSAGLDGIIRLNRDKVYPANGKLPKQYILERILAVDGMAVEEARRMKFPDKNGKLKRYSGDIAYDAATGWIRIEVSGSNGGESSNVTETQSAKSHATETRSIVAETRSASCGQSEPQPARPKPLFTKVIGFDRPHPDGLMSTVIGRRRRRQVLRALRRRPSHRSVNRVRGRAMPRRVLHAKDNARTMMPEAHSYMGMRDLPWKKYLHGEHAAQVKEAYESEIRSLKDTVLRELQPSDSEWEAAVKQATLCRALLEFKRTGVWKGRVVVRGDTEDKVALDGPEFNYASDVVGMAAIRTMLLGPRHADDVIAQVDISTAFLQSDMFAADAPPRYLKLRDPITGEMRYFRQLGVVYGSCSSSRRWQDTLHNWLVSIGFEQGKNEPCVFKHKSLDIVLASYVDDLCIKGPRSAVEHVLRLVSERFKCKEPTFLDEGSSIDHLGMYVEQTSEGVYISMHNYIDVMVMKLDMEDANPGKVKLPISKPIDDDQPATVEQGKWLLKACGCLGWLAGTSRVDLRLAHSRISQHMAAPTLGAVDAAKQAVKYCMATRELCLYQPFAGVKSWSHYSDSDHAGNAEIGNKRRSQLGYVSMYGRSPLGWGSKVSSVSFDGWAHESQPSRGLSHHPCSTPTCHASMSDLHADVSSGAAEIYAASVALSEVLHMSYVASELGIEMKLPLAIHVDNAAAIAFSKGHVRRTKLKHIDVRQAWVEAVRDSKVCVLDKVNTSDNLADFFTKILDTDRFQDLRDRMMCRHRCAGDTKDASQHRTCDDVKGASQHHIGTVTAPSGGLTCRM